MRLLVLTHSFPPHDDPRAFRWGAIVQHWRTQGITVDVITANRRCQDPSRHLDTRNLQSIGVGGTLRSRLTRSTATATATAAPSPSSATRHAIRAAAGLGRGALRRIHELTWKQVYWPDYACLWIRPAVRAGIRLMHASHYDGLITVSNPYSCHLAGLQIHRQFPNVPWLVDIGDPFAALNDAPVNNRRLHAERNWLAEAEVLRQASLVAVTTEATRQLYADTFQGVARKIEVIPPVLTADISIDPVHKLTPSVQQRRRIVYLGMLYRNLRNPHAILQAFQAVQAEPAMADWDLHFFGRINDCQSEFASCERLIGRRIFLHGQVSREAAMRELESADVLLNLGNANSVQLPSKLVEYVASRKPILNVVTDWNDASSRFLAPYSGAWTVHASRLLAPGQGREQLQRFLENCGRATFSEVQQLLAPYQLDRVAADYLAVFDHGLKIQPIAA